MSDVNAMGETRRPELESRNGSGFSVEISISASEGGGNGELESAPTAELLLALERGGLDVEGGGAGKGAGTDLGSLVLKVAETSGIVSLVGVLGAWLARDKRRTLRLQIGESSIEATGLDRDEQRALIEWFETNAARGPR